MIRAVVDIKSPIKIVPVVCSCHVSIGVLRCPAIVKAPLKIISCFSTASICNIHSVICALPLRKHRKRPVFVGYIQSNSIENFRSIGLIQQNTVVAGNLAISTDIFKNYISRFSSRPAWIRIYSGLISKDSNRVIQQSCSVGVSGTLLPRLRPFWFVHEYHFVVVVGNIATKVKSKIAINGLMIPCFYFESPVIDFSNVLVRQSQSCKPGNRRIA